MAADIMVQEYGRYFGMNTCCLVEDASLVHLILEWNYTVFLVTLSNVTSKELCTKYLVTREQVRDNSHPEDVAAFIGHFIDSPKSSEVYNLGGGKNNSCLFLRRSRL